METYEEHTDEPRSYRVRIPLVFVFTKNPKEAFQREVEDGVPASDVMSAIFVG